MGGDNIDQRVIDWIVDEFIKDQGIDLSKDKMALQRLKEAAEKAKMELSSDGDRDQLTIRYRRCDRSEALQHEAHSSQVRADGRRHSSENAFTLQAGDD